ncbi:TIGR03086 family metal-binding protein [Amycolatopsis regifaucium]|uniref:TIGR03086 family protein n=1 Tax=Amycolatopsis regifaucium TaxID=546365 RepID=A0A154MX10_9PSEU|nr:TIGR03086 family metal-binding protein [Amycolatopsis regifaucium]KZB88550.1 hypothetical protein AVL48_00230 [Amycolatopsis regifaucium]OKA07278.1 TIGR03086 family protein [Amycolatopsis regifaucium]SFI50763.1 TIGR03086 family protein [Amycolatopsis regifaucium]
MHTNELRFLDAIATRKSLDLVAHLTPEDLTRTTPCASWTLHGLLSHMATQHYGFAAAADGDGANPTHWRAIPLGEDPVADYRASVKRVLSAFAVHDLEDREFTLPEFSTEFTFAADKALGFHFIDYVVHSWDVAKTLDLPVGFDKEVLDVALKLAESIPDGKNRVAPGAAFGPAVKAAGTSTLDTIVALLGRSPSWPDSAPGQSAASA